MKEPEAGGAARLDHDEVRRLCGDIADWKISAILATGAGIDDIEVAIAWAAGEDDVMGEARRPLSGMAGAVYYILMAGQEYEDEDRTL